MEGAWRGRNASHSRAGRPDICMAPLKGITDAGFRTVWSSHFGGVDRAVAPFVHPQRSPSVPDKLVADLEPQRNRALPVVPQILNSDRDGFLALAERLASYGYREVNWNLGCPVRMVAKKRRGAGLLPHPELVTGLLDAVMDRLPVRLSIKMRLGLDDYRQARELLPRLDGYPLTEIIIHARLGVQLYRGVPAWDEFERCLELSHHRVVYNGDLRDAAGFAELSRRWPTVTGWMIGRGLLANPFLAEEIRGAVTGAAERRERLRAFHEELYRSLERRLSGPGHLLGRLKQVWIYFIAAFPGREQLLKRVVRAADVARYRRAVDEIMAG